LALVKRKTYTIQAVGFVWIYNGKEIMKISASQLVNHGIGDVFIYEKVYN